MNRFIKMLCLLLCPAMILPLCGCDSLSNPSGTVPTETDPQPTIDLNTPVCDGKTLKILCITSSFGLNTTELLYDIAVDQGATDVTVARLYASGCTLKEHVENAQNNTPAYQYTKNNSGAWKKTVDTTLLYGLQDEDWDIIFTQQSAASSPQIHTYGDYIDQLMDYVKEHKTNPNARFVWNMTWAYQGDSTQRVFTDVYGSNQMDMYNALISTLEQKVLTRTDFSAVIPTGTAIQNARTSYFGDNLTKDTFHLNNLGRIIAGYTVWAALTDKPITEIHLGPARSYDLPEPVILTEADKAVIIEAVNNAISHPHAVTPSSYPDKPENP